MSPSPYGDSCFSDHQYSIWDLLYHLMSPSPYGDSCFSDRRRLRHWCWNGKGLRPLTGIRVSLTIRIRLTRLIAAKSLRPLTGIRVSLTIGTGVNPACLVQGLRPLTGIRVSLTCDIGGVSTGSLERSPSPYGDSCFSDCG